MLAHLLHLFLLFLHPKNLLQLSLSDPRILHIPLVLPPHQHALKGINFLGPVLSGLYLLVSALAFKFSEFFLLSDLCHFLSSAFLFFEFSRDSLLLFHHLDFLELCKMSLLQHVYCLLLIVDITLFPYFLIGLEQILDFVQFS